MLEGRVTMAEEVRFPLKKEILLWALKEAQVDEDEVLHQFPNLEKWIDGEKHPTFKQIENLANYLKIPFGYMFLEKPPIVDVMEAEFRTINNKLPKMSKNLKDTIMEMDKKRNWMSDYRKKIGIDKLDIIKHFNKNKTDDAIYNAAYAKKLLKIDEYWYKSENNLEDAYKLIKSKIEEAGVLVMQNGVVGMNNYRPLDVGEFRAFMLYDDASPLIFINNMDSKAGKIFSMVHEFIHVLFEQEDLLIDDDIGSNKENERFINNITAEFLIPQKHIYMLWVKNDDHLQQVNKLSNLFKVSRYALAIKLADMTLIDNELVDNVKSLSIKDFNKKEQKSKGGDFYRTYDTRTGKVFTEAVIKEAETGEISYTYAYKLLGGIKGKTYDRIKERIMCYG